MNDIAHTIVWTSPEEWQRRNLRASSAELDCGMTWGPNGSIRVSFAPLDEDDHGFLYAHDRAANTFALLSPETTRADVEVAWAMVAELKSTSDGHLLMAEVLSGGEHLSQSHAVALWEHCADSEAAARHEYRHLAADAPQRFETASQVVLRESARVGAEDMLRQSIGPETATPPVSVRYRVLGWDTWRGAVTGPTFDDAVARMRTLNDVTSNRGFDAQATAVECGHSVVSAARVPALREFARLDQVASISASPAF